MALATLNPLPNELMIKEIKKKLIFVYIPVDKIDHLYSTLCNFSLVDYLLIIALRKVLKDSLQNHN
jgi:hypothetical protein